MFPRLGKCLVVIALVVSTGLHWAALQTIAWASMLASNFSSQPSLTEAVTLTFDGAHPCPLCKAIAAGKQSEKKSETIAPTIKMEFPPVAERFVLIPPKPLTVFSPVNVFADSVSSKPPVPPPRSFSV